MEITLKGRRKTFKGWGCKKRKKKQESNLKIKDTRECEKGSNARGYQRICKRFKIGEWGANKRERRLANA